MAWGGLSFIRLFFVLEQVGLSNFWCIYSLCIYFRYPSLSTFQTILVSVIRVSIYLFFLFFFFLRVASLFFDGSKCGYIRVGKKRAGGDMYWAWINIYSGVLSGVTVRRSKTERLSAASG